MPDPLTRARRHRPRPAASRHGTCPDLRSAPIDAMLRERGPALPL